MIDMIGVGPFITIPLIIHAMHGPQAMLGWIVGALLAMCDGLVWAELGASMPQAGGSYRISESRATAHKQLGRMMSFLFVWQLMFSAPLSIASGCLGMARYAVYVWPSLGHVLLDHIVSFGLCFWARLSSVLFITHGTFVAMGSCLLALLLLYRRVAVIGQLARYLSAGRARRDSAGHRCRARAISTPHGHSRFLPAHFNFLTALLTGLGAAMLVATYDYWGYYNVCFLGGGDHASRSATSRAPSCISIVLVAALYIVMNISILGVVPWQELDQSAPHRRPAFTLLPLACSEHSERGGPPSARS